MNNEYLNYNSKKNPHWGKQPRGYYFDEVKAWREDLSLDYDIAVEVFNPNTAPSKICVDHSNIKPIPGADENFQYLQEGKDVIITGLERLRGIVPTPLSPPESGGNEEPDNPPDDPGYNPDDPGDNPWDDPGYNPDDPGYDPAYDPSQDPGYDPNYDPAYDPSQDPNYDPNDYIPIDDNNNPEDEPYYDPVNDPEYEP